eukprot:7380366-Prymnesium_polylepis.2
MGKRPPRLGPWRHAWRSSPSASRLMRRGAHRVPQNAPSASLGSVLTRLTVREHRWMDGI